MKSTSVIPTTDQQGQQGAFPLAAGSVPPGRDNIPVLHTRRAQHYTGTARDVQKFAELAVRAILLWHERGAGSGSHLAETLGLPPSNDLRHLANVLYCARHSKEVRDQLAALAE